MRGKISIFLVAVILVISTLVSTSMANANLKHTKKEVKKEALQNYLRPKIGKAVEVEFLSGANPNFKILIPDDLTPIDLEASKMLHKALLLGYGVDFEVVKDSEYRGGAVISLGNTVLYKDFSLKPTIDLGLEGYSIAQKDGNLFLIGGSSRGSISAVIALVEEDLGGRFYTQKEGLKMPSLKPTQTIFLREYSPVLKVRSMYQYESFHKEYQLFNRVGSFTSSYDKVPQELGGSIRLPKEYFVHTFESLLPNTYFEKHPEYFALIDGKRRVQGHVNGAEFCLTNPEAREIVLKKVLKELKKYHKYGLFDVSANDNDHGSFCECKNCQAIQKREGSASGPLLDLVNYIADEVAKVYPDVMITTLAYKETNQAPKNIRPRKNVLIRLANDKALFPYPLYYVDDAKDFCANMQRWLDKGSNVFIWEYAANFFAWPLPRPNLDIIGHDIDYYAKLGVYGLFIQSSHYGVGENQGNLRGWVYSKKMWDPSRKMKDLIRDFNYGYFGKAGALMQSYSDLLESEWLRYNKSKHKLRDVFTFSDTFYPTARKIFDEALKLTKSDKELHAKVELEFVSILFYRLDQMPPKDEKDLESYKVDLKEFERLSKLYHVDWISEAKNKTPEYILKWKRKYRITDGNEEAVTLLFDLDNIDVCSYGAEKVSDIYSPTAKAIKLPMYDDKRSLEWNFGSALMRDTQYRLRLQVRAEKKSPTGKAFEYGIYSFVLNQPEKIVISGKVDASQIKDKGYCWIDCGVVNGTDAQSSSLYISQMRDSSLKYLYVCSAELIPVTKEKSKK